MTMNMHRRQWLQILGLACVSHAPTYPTRQVHEDLLAVTEPDALPAMDWGDLIRIRDGWGPSPWHCSVTGRHGDLGTILADFRHAVQQHQHALGTTPATALVVVRGNGAAFRLADFVEVHTTISSAVNASTELWFGAAHDLALVDAFRVTVVMDARA